MKIVNFSETDSLLSVFVREIRDITIQNDRMRFRRNIERIAEIMAYEISREMHYKRINILWTTMMFVEFAAAFANLGIGIANLFMDEQLGNFSYGNLIIGGAVLAFGILFLALDLPIRRKIKKLRQEKAIHE